MKTKNRFNAQVVLPSITIGLKNRTDVETTPQMLIRALEKFCSDARRILAENNQPMEPRP